MHGGTITAVQRAWSSFSGKSGWYVTYGGDDRQVWVPEEAMPTAGAVIVVETAEGGSLVRRVTIDNQIVREEVRS